jgi:transposase-like protein
MGYPPEFPRRVVDLVERGRKISEIALEPGVSEQTIYVWRRQAWIDWRRGASVSWNRSTR